VQVKEVVLSQEGVTTFGEGVAYESTIRLVTGRTHQIRAQLATLGLPLLGDVLYSTVLQAGKLQRCLPLVDTGGGTLVSPMMGRSGSGVGESDRIQAAVDSMNDMDAEGAMDTEQERRERSAGDARDEAHACLAEWQPQDAKQQSELQQSIPLNGATQQGAVDAAARNTASDATAGAGAESGPGEMQGQEGSAEASTACAVSGGVPVKRSRSSDQVLSRRDGLLREDQRLRPQTGITVDMISETGAATDASKVPGDGSVTTSIASGPALMDCETLHAKSAAVASAASEASSSGAQMSEGVQAAQIADQTQPMKVVEQQGNKTPEWVVTVRAWVRGEGSVNAALGLQAGTLCFLKDNVLGPAPCTIDAGTPWWREVGEQETALLE
jgi:hypothetical protein